MSGASWDSHVHVFGTADRYPLSPRRGYTPPERTLEQLESVAAAAGVGHAVLVQPSVYDADHRCMEAALRAGGGRHRGVAVLPPDVGADRLRQLHALGVRGVRFNLVSPAGNRLDGFEEIARRIAPLGWHIQFLVAPRELPAVAALREKVAVPFVLDHLGGLTADLEPEGDVARPLLALLARGDCWVKLSGFYRLSKAGAPYDDMDRLVARLSQAAPERILWGSDWPHTWHMEPGHGPAPSYGDTLAPIRRCLAPELQHQALVENPATLYT